MLPARSGRGMGARDSLGQLLLLLLNLPLAEPGEHRGGGSGVAGGVLASLAGLQGWGCWMRWGDRGCWLGTLGFSLLVGQPTGGGTTGTGSPLPGSVGPTPAVSHRGT